MIYGELGVYPLEIDIKRRPKVKICQDGMLEDTNSLDSAQMVTVTYGNHPTK